MPLEIERKYLVYKEYKKFVTQSYEIKQGYLSTDPQRTVRVRIRDKKGFITIKGASDMSGISRFEWEKEIPFDEALELLNICLPNIISKTRHIIKYKQHIIEVDEFQDENKGLILAEIELNYLDQKIEKPSWLGQEVTNDKRYYNSHLAQHAYSTW
ncbi:MAG: CYTH domain-containing protein [Salinivirgaceae bacterium]|nr:CYTH domain-containing protein [Salinivirgaceae bacterium]